jgi:hypothetical protein
MKAKALKASNIAVKKSPPIVAKPNLHEMSEAGDQIVQCWSQLSNAVERLEAEDCTPADIEAAKAIAAEWQRFYAPKVAKFNDAVDVFNRAGYDDEEAKELSRQFIGEHIAKMIGACAVAPHSPEMYARVMIEAIMEARINNEENVTDEAPTPLGIEATFRQIIRKTNKSNFAPSVPIVLEALQRQQSAWNTRIACADCVQGWYDALIKLLDQTNKQSKTGSQA